MFSLSSGSFVLCCCWGLLSLLWSAASCAIKPHVWRRDSSWPFWSAVNRKGCRSPFPLWASLQDNEQVLRRQKSRLTRKVCSLSSVSLARSLDVQREPWVDGRANTDGLDVVWELNATLTWWRMGFRSRCVYQAKPTHLIAVASGFLNVTVSDKFCKPKYLGED